MEKVPKLDQPSTKSIRQYRWMLNIGALILVSSVIWALIRMMSPGDTLTLEGVGCEMIAVSSADSEADLQCHIQNGAERKLLRDCRELNQSGEEPCAMSAYELGKVEGAYRYLLFRSESIADILTIYRVNRETLEQEEVGTYFYTGTESGCRESKATYEENCFPYPLTPEQRSDLWKTNQQYQEMEEKYKE